MRRLARTFLAAALLLPAACGFQLRGSAGDTLPPALSVLNVAMVGTLAYPPLLLAMRDALRAQPGITVSEGAAAPTLMLLGEQFTVDVLAIDTSGLVTDYVVNYGASYKLLDATGKDWLPASTIKLQRQYPFNRLNVLAMEKEQDYLLVQMRRDAVNQIVRRLSHVPPAPIAPATPSPAPATSTAPTPTPALPALLGPP